MTAYRSPADIARDLRYIADGLLRSDLFGRVNTREAIAQEVEALPVLTTEEVADLRAAAYLLNASGWSRAERLGAILDRIDPPPVEMVDDAHVDAESYAEVTAKFGGQCITHACKHYDGEIVTHGLDWNCVQRSSSRTPRPEPQADNVKRDA